MRNNKINDDRERLLLLLQEARDLAEKMDVRLWNGGEVRSLLAALLEDLREPVH